MQLVVAGTSAIEDKIGFENALGQRTVIDRTGALYSSTKGTLLMSMAWLRGLWAQLPPSLRALCLYVIEIAIGVIVYAVFRMGTVGMRLISDFVPIAGSSQICMFVEWLIMIAGVIVVTVFVGFSTVRCVKELYEAFSRRRLAGSAGQPSTQQPTEPPAKLAPEGGCPCSAPDSEQSENQRNKNTPDESPGR